MNLRRTKPVLDRDRSTTRSDLLVVLGAVGLLTVGMATGAFEAIHHALETTAPALADSASGFLFVAALAGTVIATLQRRRARADRRRRAETEVKYRAMIEHVPAVTYAWDPGHKPGTASAAYISPQVERLLGFSSQQCLEDPGLWDRQMHQDDISDVMSAWSVAVEAGAPFGAEYRMRTVTGQEIWVRDEASPITVEGLTQYQGVIFDISHRKYAEQGMRDSQALLTAIVGSALDAIVSMDPSGSIVEFNPAAERIFGHRRDDVIGRPLAEVIVPPDLREAHKRGLAHLRETGEGPILGQRLELMAMRADGSEFPAELAVTRFELRGHVSFTGFLRDITQRKAAEEQLRSTQERYRSLVEQLPAVVYIDAVDEIATALYVSPQYERLTGYTPAERLADPELWMGIVHPDDQERVIAESNRTNETGEDYDIDHRIVRKDGRIVWVHDHAIFVRSDNGDDAWQGVLTDITDRKFAEEALTTRERILEAAGYAAERFLLAPSWRECIDDVLERFALAGSATRAGVFENSGERSNLRVALRHAWTTDDAPASLDLPGAPPIPYGEGYARWVEELGKGGVIHGPVSELPEGERTILEQAGIRSSMIVPVIVDDTWWGYIGLDDCGHDRVWQTAEIDAVRVVASTLAAAIDREQRARLLTEAEERYRAIVEHVPAAVYLDRPDRSMRSIYVSPQIEEITGVTPQEWIDEPDVWLTIIAPEDWANVQSTYLEAVTARRPWQAEYRVNRRDGRTIWVHDETTFITDADGKPMFLQGVLMDITERKLAEQSLRDSAAHEREAAEKLRALDEMKNTFLAAVSHELRSPLTSILGLSITLERAPEMEAGDRGDLLERLAFNARKLDRLLKDLLDIDRLNRGIVEPQYRTVDAASITRRAVESLDGLGGRTIEIDAEPLVLTIDPPKLERIVENLVTNAARHTHATSRIWVTLKPVEGGAILSVEDDGPGVPVDLREAIFEPFRQGPTASPHSPGTGVGLSLVAKFSELHGGRAWVEDRPGGGAAFRVFLPSAPGAGSEATQDGDVFAPASADVV